MKQKSSWKVLLGDLVTISNYGWVGLFPGDSVPLLHLWYVTVGIHLHSHGKKGGMNHEGLEQKRIFKQYSWDFPGIVPNKIFSPVSPKMSFNSSVSIIPHIMAPVPL